MKSRINPLLLCFQLCTFAYFGISEPHFNLILFGMTLWLMLPHLILFSLAHFAKNIWLSYAWIIFNAVLFGLTIWKCHQVYYNPDGQMLVIAFIPLMEIPPLLILLITQFVIQKFRAKTN